MHIKQSNREITNHDPLVIILRFLVKLVAAKRVRDVIEVNRST